MRLQVEEGSVTYESIKNDPDPDLSKQGTWFIEYLLCFKVRELSMDAILLAGGYATRLYPLTKNRPKALLTLGGRSILDRNMEALDASSEFDRFFLVTNERFVDMFRQWAEERPLRSSPVYVLSDGTDSNENRLGAIGDIKYVLDTTDIDRSDFLYVAGTDNVADFDITGIVSLARKRSATALFAYRYPDTEKLSSKGVVSVDTDGKVKQFAEKSDNPPGNLVVPPYYVYSPEAVCGLEEFLGGGNNPDAPGYFISWLVERHPVYAIVSNGKVLDIGTPEAYHAALSEYSRFHT